MRWLLLLALSVEVPWRQGIATAYAADCPGAAAHLRDGSPTDWTKRSAAADLRYWPLGTVIEVCFDDGSCRAYTVRDSGKAVRGSNRLDLLVRSCAYARKFGAQKVSFRKLEKR
jgi:3D (Asp-Asp-Asp) domain-containing protein